MMVGLGNIKEHLRSLLDTLEIDQQRQLAMPGVAAERATMHMTFVGNPGTGKTAVAQLVAGALKEMGILRSGHLVVATKADLLGRYSNHVARNTRAVVQRALGGVLFIDEAYSLLQGEADLGREVLNVLVDMCYAHKDDLVVVLAGYTSAMASLFDANAGLASRFPYRFLFEDYSARDLEEIATRMLEASHFSLADAEATDALRRLVAPIPSEMPCGNARAAESRLGMAINAQSTRLRAQQQQQQQRATVSAGPSGPTITTAAAVAVPELFQLTAADLDAAAALADRSRAALDAVRAGAHDAKKGAGNKTFPFGK